MGHRGKKVGSHQGALTQNDKGKKPQLKSTASSANSNRFFNQLSKEAANPPPLSVNSLLENLNLNVTGWSNFGR